VASQGSTPLAFMGADSIQRIVVEKKGPAKFKDTSTYGPERDEGKDPGGDLKASRASHQNYVFCLCLGQACLLLLLCVFTV